MFTVHKVLVVASEESATNSIKNSLEKYNFEIETSTNSVEALQIAKSKQFNLVITDTQISEGNSLDFFTELKKNNYTPQVMLLTTSGDKSLVKTAASLGVNQFLLKPITEDKLLEKIRESLTIEEEELVAKKDNPLQVLVNTIEDSVLLVEIYGCSQESPAEVIIGQIEKEFIGHPKVGVISLVIENKFAMSSEPIKILDEIAEGILNRTKFPQEKTLIEGSFLKVFPKMELENTKSLRNCKLVFPKK
ncbi:MAG: response regulator [Leptospiraceae bacterium]|nr:response regulator [Leptospiraceae bacterium]